LLGNRTLINKVFFSVLLAFQVIVDDANYSSGIRYGIPQIEVIKICILMKVEIYRIWNCQEQPLCRRGVKL